MNSENEKIPTLFPMEHVNLTMVTEGKIYEIGLRPLLLNE